MVNWSKLCNFCGEKSCRVAKERKKKKQEIKEEDYGKVIN